VRIVVLDGHALNPGDNPWDPVAALGDFEVYDSSPRATVVARARGAEVVVTNKTRLPADALAALDGLRLIAVLATGYDNVDVAAARARGVTVCNVPAYATDSVAQHVFALLLEIAQRPAAHDAAIRDGAWQRSGEFTFWLSAPLELAGRTLGIVGYGRIGQRVAALAHAFGMNVLCATRSTGARAAPSSGPLAFVPLARLLAESDVVSLHCPLTPETERMIDAAALACMRDDAILINTARGRLIDEDALAAALRSGRLAGAGLDTLSREPPPPDHPLLSAPRCVLTPHMAWASLAARRRLMLATAENIRAFVQGRPQNVVS
jgi:glycerate dehydrogenase